MIEGLRFEGLLEKSLVFLLIMASGIFISGVLQILLGGMYRKNVTKMDEGTFKLILRIVKYAIYFISLIIALQQVGLQITGILAAVGFGGLVFALAAQQALSNVFSGIFIAVDKPFRIGDRIEVGGRCRYWTEKHKDSHTRQSHHNHTQQRNGEQGGGQLHQ